MALVRPASARSAPPYGLILFVFLWVITLIVAIFFYMQYGTRDAAARDAQAELVKLGNNEDRRTAADLFPTSAEQRTLLGAAVSQVTKLKTDLEAANTQNATLTQQLKLATDELDSRKKALADLTKSQEDLHQQLLTSQATYKKSVDDLNARVAELSKNNDSTDAARNADNQRLQKQITEMASAQETKDRANLAQVQTLNSKIAELQTEINKLQTIIGVTRHSGQGNTLAEPDGEITRAGLGDNTVFVNVGAKQHAQVGLTFAVYDPHLGMIGGDGNIRTIGAIEIVSCYETESMARITHVEKGQSILAGDLIGNPIFHGNAHRKFHFVVAGDFDIDGDGIATPAEHEKIIRLITNYGGVLDDTITPETDYLVLGAPPAASTRVIESASTEPDVFAKKQIDEHKRYDDLIVKAHDYTIPILNTNRFLALIGYYSTTIVAQPLYPVKK